MTVAELITRLQRIPDQSMVVTIHADFGDEDGAFVCADDPLDDECVYLDFQYQVGRAPDPID